MAMRMQDGIITKLFMRLTPQLDFGGHLACRCVSRIRTYVEYAYGSAMLASRICLPKIELRRKSIVPLICIGLFSCVPASERVGGTKDILDPEAGLSRADYENALHPKQNKKRGSTAATQEGAEPSIPETTDILTAPQPPQAGPDKLVSISVTEDVSLKDVLIELSRLADTDMEIDPGITGGIILKVTNRPFNEVMERVVELGGLRYYNKNGILRVERDLPYQVNYSVDFLNVTRSSTGNVSINTNVIGSGSSSGSSGSSTSTSTSGSGSSSSGSSGGSISSGSSSQIQTSYDGDLWLSVENTIKAMLAIPAAGDSTAANTATDSATTASNNININKQAGVIAIIATDKQHKDIEEYLNQVKRSVSAQVLIEAKIVEVTLNKEFRSGIDWGTLADADSLGLGLTGNFKGGISTAADFLTLKAGQNLTSTLSLMEKFGTSRTLSSPRLHAMNNQQAVLTFAENNVYFTLEAQEETDGTGADAVRNLTVQSTLNTVPIGIILTLQPSINLDSNEITMNIRPTLSRITGTVNDPGVDIIVARNAENNENATTVTSEIPVIEVRELDSILKVKSGEVMIIGGLMKEVSTNEDTGVPFISRAPIIGNAFKSVEKTHETVETVIFIKATIIPSDSKVDKQDQNVYKTFVRDPRPLAF